MKKLYILMAAGAAFLTASAAPALTTELQRPAGKPNTLFHSADVVKLDSRTKVVKGMRKADGNKSIEGDWTFTLMDWYMEDATFTAIQLPYVATLNDNVVTFTDPSGSSYSFIGVFDAATNEVTFSKEDLGTKDGYKMYQEPFEYDWESNRPVFESITATFSPEMGMLVFDQSNGIFWSAYQGSSFAGYFAGYDLLAGTLDFSGEWNDVGQATLMDGWLQPTYGFDQLANQYHVLLQQNSENEGLYRLVNPYKSGPLASINDFKGNGYIVFDISDPDHVTFPLSQAGFANNQGEISLFFAYNYLSVMMYVNPAMTKQELIEYFDRVAPIPYSTYKDGIVTINGSLPNDGGPNTRYGFNNYPFYGAYIDADMTARILFPGADGVESIVDESENAPAVYYNLQGVKIQNPEKGQVVIKNQGNKASKVVF